MFWSSTRVKEPIGAVGQPDFSSEFLSLSLLQGAVNVLLLISPRHQFVSLKNQLEKPPGPDPSSGTYWNWVAPTCIGDIGGCMDRMGGGWTVGGWLQTCSRWWHQLYITFAGNHMSYLPIILCWHPRFQFMPEAIEHPRTQHGTKKTSYHNPPSKPSHLSSNFTNFQP
jgi:hypothetical protein